MRKVGAYWKSNNSSKGERPRWADYEDFEEDVDGIGNDGFNCKPQEKNQGWIKLKKIN